MSKFSATLKRAWERQGSLLCVGLDPDLEKLPTAMRAGASPLFAFNREIIDATAPWVCAFKPQIAYYAALAAEAQLQQTMDYIKQHYPHIPVILDAKRGDIGATAKMYAREVFDRYQADGVTVNPYLGFDALQPFLDYTDKGIFILCRTSNPGSGDLQQLTSGDRTLAQHIAATANARNDHGNVGLVVAATWAQEVAAIRELAGDLPLLVPGIGTQGGDLRGVLAGGLNPSGTGLLVNAARSILYAGEGNDFATAAARAAETLCGQINAYRPAN